MINLTKLQQQIIVNEIMSHPDIKSADELSAEVWNDLVEIRDSETLYSDINFIIGRISAMAEKFMAANPPGTLINIDSNKIN